MYVPVAGFAFDALARPLAGWPVELGCCFAGQRMDGDRLELLEVMPLGDVTGPGQPFADLRRVTVAADGKVVGGARVPEFDPCCNWTVGSNGVAYGTAMLSGIDQITPEKSQVTALDASGPQAGWPLTLDGLASAPAVRPDGRVVVTAGSLVRSESRVVAVDPGAKAISFTSPVLPTARADFGSVGGCSLGNPQTPLVAGDGTTFVLGWADGAVFALDPSLAVILGWPYRAPTPFALRDSRYVREDAFCPSLGLPALGSDGTLYLPLEPADATAGGSIVAVGRDGGVRPGWPVQLKRRGAEFWSVAAGPEGTAYGLAVELETSSTSSATIVAMAPDSTVVYTTTIVEP
jgi:outer membrane protein assembly factor BamB